MGMLRLMGYGAYVLGAIALILTVEEFIFIAFAISLVASGTLFLAADRVIVVLCEIRDRLPKPVVVAASEEPVFVGSPRSPEEIAADLQKLRAAQP